MWFPRFGILFLVCFITTGQCSSVLERHIAEDDDFFITETLTRFVYTCPCDHFSSLSLGTAYSSSVADQTKAPLDGNDPSSTSTIGTKTIFDGASSSFSTTNVASPSDTQHIPTDPTSSNPNTTTNAESTTNHPGEGGDFSSTSTTAPDGVTITAPTGTMSGTSATTVTTTTAGSNDVQSNGQPFSIQIQTNGGLGKRDVSFVGYVDGVFALVLASSQAVAFALSPQGTVVVYGTSLTLGFTSGSGTLALAIFPADSTSSFTAVQVSGSSVIVAGGSFCVDSGNTLQVNIGAGTDSSCSPVFAEANTAADSFNTALASSIIASTPQTSLSVTATTISGASVSTSLNAPTSINNSDDTGVSETSAASQSLSATTVPDHNGSTLVSSNMTSTIHDGSAPVGSPVAPTTTEITTAMSLTSPDVSSTTADGSSATESISMPVDGSTYSDVPATSIGNTISISTTSKTNFATETLSGFDNNTSSFDGTATTSVSVISTLPTTTEAFTTYDSSVSVDGSITVGDLTASHTSSTSTENSASTTDASITLVVPGSITDTSTHSSDSTTAIVDASASSDFSTNPSGFPSADSAATTGIPSSTTESTTALDEIHTSDVSTSTGVPSTYAISDLSEHGSTLDAVTTSSSIAASDTSTATTTLEIPDTSDASDSLTTSATPTTSSDTSPTSDAAINTETTATSDQGATSEISSTYNYDTSETLTSVQNTITADSSTSTSAYSVVSTESATTAATITFEDSNISSDVTTTATETSPTSDFTTSSDIVAITDYTTISDATTSDISTSTTVANPSTPTAGEPFSITVDTGTPVGKRDIMVVGFIDGQLVLVSDLLNAVPFVLTTNGVLMIFGTELVVGLGGSSGTLALTIYSSVSDLPTAVAWSFDSGALILPGAGFCIGEGNVMSVNVGTATDSSCAPVTVNANTAPDSYNIQVASSITPSPLTSTAINTSATATDQVTTTTNNADSTITESNPTTASEMTETTLEATSATEAAITTASATATSVCPLDVSTGDDLLVSSKSYETPISCSECSLPGEAEHPHELPVCYGPDSDSIYICAFYDNSVAQLLEPNPDGFYVLDVSCFPNVITTSSASNPTSTSETTTQPTSATSIATASPVCALEGWYSGSINSLVAWQNYSDPTTYTQCRQFCQIQAPDAPTVGYGFTTALDDPNGDYGCGCWSEPISQLVDQSATGFYFSDISCTSNVVAETNVSINPTNSEPVTTTSISETKSTATTTTSDSVTSTSESATSTSESATSTTVTIDNLIHLDPTSVDPNPTTTTRLDLGAIGIGGNLPIVTIIHG